MFCIVEEVVLKVGMDDGLWVIEGYSWVDVAVFGYGIFWCLFKL